MAAWEFYDFIATSNSWVTSISPITAQMRSGYERAGKHRAVLAEAFLRASAAALAMPRVQAELSKYRVTGDFKISVPHPDRDLEFYLPSNL